MDMFKPQISILIDRGGDTYSLHATVKVPTGCYVSLGAALKAPDDVVVIAEVEAVSLHLTHTKMFCSQAVEYRQFVLSGIPINEAKPQLLAFTVVDGDVVASASANVPGGFFGAAVQQLDAEELPDVALVSFSGWINAMPVGPRKINVTAVLSPEAANGEFELERVGPFGFTGRTLLFKLRRTPGSISGVIHYQEDDVGDFDSVALLLRDGIVSDELDIVH